MIGAAVSPYRFQRPFFWSEKLRFEETPLQGCKLVHAEPRIDDRGHFARTWCSESFRDAGLETSLSQCNVSYNRHARTLRGLHWQAEPHTEAKLVRVLRGAVFDVAVDLRHDSETYCRWFGTRLDGDQLTALYVPKGFAHGFLTLTDDAELLYLMSDPYVPGASRGARWNDPAFKINWPAEPQVLSDKDRQYPDFRP